MQNRPSPIMMEFHVARQARDRYGFDEELYTTNGNVVLANIHAARLFAQKINAQRDLVNHPESAVRAGQLNAMGLIDEILHQVVAQYRQQQNPQVMQEALDYLERRLGVPGLDATLKRFIDQFPPLDVYRNAVTSDDYLNDYSIDEAGRIVSNRELALEEMLMLWLENNNPAFSPFLELFDDAVLERETEYFRVFPVLFDFFAKQPKYGPLNQNLLNLLLAPARAYPDSLEAQLNYLRSTWGELISTVVFRLMGGIDTIHEEDKPVLIGAGGPGGPGPSPVAEFVGDEYINEPEQFSVDLDWMPNLVLLAKNTYVWLDQLARKYGRPISHLDEVPDEELEQMHRRGITGLWLIGLWERSPASQRIKQLRGKTDAVASAYSLFYYDIAADLGGDEAYARLRDRAWRAGIRLASDMVPNHMGIDSRWVIEHPEWFIQLPYSPFPAYTFTGPNLSWDGRTGLFIEDHYFDNTDAAVVFKRVDFWTGEERYIYHGNDGTSIPWNDTAQLNYLISEVREAVIQTILHVARKFPIIRFDAAMTLAKKHFQRLWYPEPGSGGAIASRAEAGMTKEQFDEVFPEEFWRTVVDRVAQEAPDTLLLAEAFWLMEGYFVRTLGMHRVYNSAFMNMLRDEKNQEYRQVVKNTLEFDPEILKRYVNFMNNPDERTAVDQFGKGDKYFGACTLLATMPGLPMVGHGQIEGFAEKYGMEFRYPMWHEQADADLVARHEAEIFPLLRRRYLFAEVHNFLLYDFYNSDDSVNEDVYAYSNRAGDEGALVFYNNRYAEAQGRIHSSTAFTLKSEAGEEKTLVQRTLGEGLGLSNSKDFFTVYRDHRTGLEYIRSSRELSHYGLHLTLGAYQYYVFIGFRQVQDTPDGRYARLANELAGRGTPDMEASLQEMLLAPVLGPFRELVNPGMFGWLIQNRLEAEIYTPENYRMALDEVESKAQRLLTALLQADVALVREAIDRPPARVEPGIQTVESSTEKLPAVKVIDAVDQALSLAIEAALPSTREPDRASVADISVEIRALAEAMLSLASIQRSAAKYPGDSKAAVEYLLNGPDGETFLKHGGAAEWGVLLSCMVIAPLGRLAADRVSDQNALPAAAELPGRGSEISRRWLDELLFGKQVAETLAGMGVEPQAARRSEILLGLLVGQENWLRLEIEAARIAEELLDGWRNNENVRRYLLVHSFDGALWFNKEAFEALVWWTFTWQIVRLFASVGGADELHPQMDAAYRVAQLLLEAEAKSGYQLERLSI